MGLRTLGRFVVRNRWVLFLSILATTLLGLVGTSLIGVEYDAHTVLQPTDRAVEYEVNAINANGPKVAITDDMRMTVVNEIALGVGYDSNVGQAINSLANADQLVANLGQFTNVARVTSVSKSPSYTEVISVVKSGIQQMSAEEIKSIEDRTGIASGLWPDFVYLYAKLKALDFPMDFLQPGQLPQTVADVAKATDVRPFSPRDAYVTVRDSNPRLAEIYADAITANYKYYYDKRNHSIARKNLLYCQEQALDRQRAFRKAASAAVKARKAAGGDQTAREVAQIEATYAVNDAAAQLSSATREYEAARSELIAAEKGGALNVAFWAGLGRSTPDHVESPAEEAHSPAKARVLTASPFVGLLLGCILAMGQEGRRMKRPIQPESMPAEPPVIVMGGAKEEDF